MTELDLGGRAQRRRRLRQCFELDPSLLLAPETEQGLGLHQARRQCRLGRPQDVRIAPGTELIQKPRWKVPEHAAWLPGLAILGRPSDYQMHRGPIHKRGAAGHLVSADGRESLVRAGLA